MTDEELRRTRREIYEIRGQVLELECRLSKLLASMPVPEHPAFVELHTFIYQPDGTVRECEE